MSAQPTIASEAIQVGGPYWEQLSVGDRYVEFPALTLTEGHAALHQSIVGDRLRLALDATLSDKVAGRRLAHPMLVCDVSIGQSTLPTQRVIGNLFYRRLMLRRLPAIGDTLYTTTEIVALKRNTIKEGRKPTGLAVLHIVTTDQEDRAILDYWRCAMLPIRDLDASQPHADDLDQFPADLPDDALHATLDGLDLGAYRERGPRRALRRPHRADDLGRRRRRQRHGRDRARAPVAEHRQGAHRPRLALTPASASSTAGTRSASPPRSSRRRCRTS